MWGRHVTLTPPVHYPILLSITRGCKESNPVLEDLESSAVPSGPTPRLFSKRRRSQNERPGLIFQTGPFRHPALPGANRNDGLAYLPPNYPVYSGPQQPRRMKGRRQAATNPVSGRYAARRRLRKTGRAVSLQIRLVGWCPSSAHFFFGESFCLRRPFCSVGAAFSNFRRRFSPRFIYPDSAFRAKVAAFPKILFGLFYSAPGEQTRRASGSDD